MNARTGDDKALTSAIIGAAIEVHKALGPGYLESVYEEAMVVELSDRHIVFERQKPIELMYKQHPIGQARLDLLVENSVVVELKAVDKIGPIHTAQLISYLKATQLHRGLIINFNVPFLKEGIVRVAL